MPLLELVVEPLVKKIGETLVGAPLEMLIKRDVALKNAYRSIDVLANIESGLGRLESAITARNGEDARHEARLLIDEIDKLNQNFQKFAIKMEVYVSRRTREEVQEYLGFDPFIMEAVLKDFHIPAAAVVGALQATRLARDKISEFIRKNYKIEQH